jgi:hypothetical protein
MLKQRAKHSVEVAVHLPPVNQEADSIFFDNISADLPCQYVFQGPSANSVD